MFLYLCERILRFIRYMQHVHYRKVGDGCHVLTSFYHDLYFVVLLFKPCVSSSVAVLCVSSKIVEHPFSFHYFILK